MTAVDTATQSASGVRLPGWIARWWRRRRTDRRRIEYAVWDLRERYGAAAYCIARASARMPVGFERRKFWSRVAKRLRPAWRF